MVQLQAFKTSGGCRKSSKSRFSKSLPRSRVLQIRNSRKDAEVQRFVEKEIIEKSLKISETLAYLSVFACGIFHARLTRMRWSGGTRILG